MYSVCVCASIFKFSTSTSISLLRVYSNLIDIFAHVHLLNASTSLFLFAFFGAPNGLAFEGARPETAERGVCTSFHHGFT